MEKKIRSKALNGSVKENVIQSLSEVFNTSKINVQDVPNIGATETTEPAKLFIKTEIDVLDRLLVYIKPINFREFLNIPDDVKIVQKHIVVGVIKNLRHVAEKNKWNIAKVYDYIYVFNGQYWLQIERELFKTFLGKVAINLGCAEFDSIHYEFKERLLKQFDTDGFLLPPSNVNKEILINLQNGTYEIINGIGNLRNFDPKDFLTYQLPFCFDQKGDCVLFKTYLNKVLPDLDSQKVLQEYIGYVFLKEMNLEKCLVLTGSGQNGKSVFFNVICALLGEQNVLNYQMASFAHEYKRAKLVNILLNYSSEKGNDLDVDTFKALVSGEPLQAREPYGKPFTVKNKVRFVINANELPKETEQTDAYFRRFLLIPFEIKIKEEEKDINLASKIIKNELPGVFNWALQGLKRLLEQEKFTHCEKSLHAVEEFRKQSDSIALFIEECNVVPNVHTKTALKDLYNDYKNYCIDDNYRPFAKRKFGNRLEGLGFERTRLTDGSSAFFADRVKKKFFISGSEVSVDSEKEPNLNEPNELNIK